jgi:hypothetical protein
MPIGASACPMAAFSGFYESHEPTPLGDARSIVPAHCDGHRNGQQRGYILHDPCVDCLPGSRRGDTEQVVARWRHPVAFCEALVMLYQVMRSVLHRMAREGGTFVCHHRLFQLL